YFGELVRDIRHDQRIPPGILHDLPAWAQNLCQDRRRLIGFGIVQDVGLRNRLCGQFLLKPQVSSKLFFRLKGVVFRNSKNVALELSPELKVLQNDIESLVPRNVGHRQRDGAADCGIQNDIQTREVMEK